MNNGYRLCWDGFALSWVGSFNISSSCITRATSRSTSHKKAQRSPSAVQYSSRQVQYSGKHVLYSAKQVLYSGKQVLYSGKQVLYSAPQVLYSAPQVRLSRPQVQHTSSSTVAQHYYYTNNIGHIAPSCPLIVFNSPAKCFNDIHCHPVLLNIYCRVNQRTISNLISC